MTLFVTLAETTGSGITEEVDCAVPVQPAAEVPVTV